MIFNDDNPVVLQIDGRWHIVENSRASTHALCGKKVQHRGAHARLKHLGVENVCPKCVKLGFSEAQKARS